MEENKAPIPQNRKTNPGGKKRLTKAQRRRRFYIKRYCVFGSMALIMILLIALIVLMITKLVGGTDSSSSSTSDSGNSVQHAVCDLPTPTPTPPSTVTLLAVGDNLIHSTIYEYAEQEDGTYDFTEVYSQLKDEIQAVDLACIQQETIFVSDPSLYSNYPVFGTPADMATSLYETGFDVVCHASNHTYDQLQTGLDDTFAAWAQYPEVTVLGIHQSQAEADEITIVEKNDIRIAMFDYTYGLNYSVPEDDYLIDFIDDDHREKIIAELDSAQEQADFVIVFMHMGTEDQFTPDESQKEWAQLLADHGVDLIIGTHPHVVEPVETLTGANGNETLVYWSLGNFVSSQNENINLIGAMANVTITKDSTGTYVSDHSIEPVVTLIQGGGTNGKGYIFHVMHLEDYTDDLGETHIRENCMPSDFQSVWNDIFADTENSDAAQTAA